MCGVAFGSALNAEQFNVFKVKIQFFELHFISPIYGFGFWSVQNESKGGLRVLSVAK